MKKGIWMHKELVILLMTLLLYFASFTTVLDMPAEGGGKGTVLLGLYQHGEAEFWVREREGTLESSIPLKRIKRTRIPSLLPCLCRNKGRICIPLSVIAPSVRAGRPFALNVTGLARVWLAM